MRKIPIAFCFDNRLTDAACICISSLMMNANPDTFYDIFIIHSQDEKLIKSKLCSIPKYYPNCNIQFRTIDRTFDNAYEIRGITTPAYYRLLIPQLIPEYDIIIYSDVDVIFRSDLSSYYDTAGIDNYYFAGVDSLSYLNPSLIHYYEDGLGISSKGIIYSGNLIINSRKIREDNLAPQFIRCAQNNYMFQDMDVINIVCQGKIMYLPPAFCVTTYFSEYSVYNRDVLYRLWDKKEVDDALIHGIVHYNGKKPWTGVCINFDLWWEYYRKSPFYDSKFYFDFFNAQLNMFDSLPLWKRIKILLRYFYKR